MENFETYKDYLDKIVYAMKTLHLTMSNIKNSATIDYYGGYITYDQLQTIRDMIDSLTNSKQ